MMAYLGWQRSTEVECEPVDMGCGAGKVACFECEGSGNWDRYLPEPTGRPLTCVSCKGQGWLFVGIA